MKKIKWLENLLGLFEEEANRVISSVPKTKNAEKLFRYHHKRLWAKHLLQLTKSLRKIVSEKKTLKEAIITTMILMYNAYEVGWPMTYSQIKQIDRGKIVGSRTKKKKWVMEVKDAIPERYNRPKDKLRYLMAHIENNPLKLQVGNIYVDLKGEKGGDRLVYDGPQGEESITIESFRRKYLTKKVGT